MNGPRSNLCDSLVLDVEENVIKCLFLCWESNRQLSSVRRCLKDKSTAFRCRISFCNNANFRKNVVLIVITLALMLLLRLVSLIVLPRSLITALLFIAGLELNPGPGSHAGGKFGVLSQNCRGLTDRSKLIRLLRKIYPCRLSSNNNNDVIACLQETHRIDKFAVDNMFDGSIVNDEGERNQRGVCILVPESYEVVQSNVSGNGRWAIAIIRQKASQSSEKIVVATVYAPNCHREAHIFFQDFFSELDELLTALALRNEAFNVIVCGDFNVVLEPSTGSINRISTKAEKEVAQLVKDSMSARALVEPSPLNQQQLYTWRRGLCFSKLDYVFVSNSLIPMVASGSVNWHEFGSNLDHAAVRIGFKGSSEPARGRSFPKLFQSDILRDVDRQWLASQLEHCQSQFLDHWNPHQKLEFTKIMLRTKTLELRQMKKFEDSISSIKEEINSIVRISPITREQAVQLEQLRQRLSAAEDQEAEVYKIKAGVKWREEGEKSTAYFLARFKARTAAAMMHSINLGTRIVSGPREVLSVVRQFYERLYNSREPVKIDDSVFCNDFFANCPTMDIQQSRNLARPLDIAELKEALKSCSDSAPGLDGIPYSYYSAFPIMLDLVLDSWNYALTSGSLAKSHRQSCLTLLPKKDKDLSHIGNWRPISLSACDLKIITKAFANRLKAVLPSIICESQVAYTPGRDISFNNRLLQYAKLYSRKHSLDYCVVSLDARKAFDSVSHRYLAKVLEVYGFPQEFISVFNLLYANLSSVVQVNGFLSSEFEIRNGVKQGDALSCGLFNLAMDPLLRNLLQNAAIEGLCIPTSERELIEIKVLSYADDVTVVCRNGDLQPIFDEYQRLSLVSGLVLNADKTEVLNFTQSPTIISVVDYMEVEYQLGRKDWLRACGIWLADLPETEYQKNIIDRIQGMESIILGWGKRQLSLNGRMVLAKTFLLSQIVFPAQVVEIQKKEIKRIERLIYSFVNGAKNLYGPERIARRHLKASKDSGGINGIDVECFIQAIIVRNFCKAATQHRVLRELQHSTMSLPDDISKIAQKALRVNCRKFAELLSVPDLRELGLISGIPLSTIVLSNSRASEQATNESLESLASVQLAYNSGGRLRKAATIIMRSLPNQFSILIRASLLIPSETSSVWITDSGIKAADSMSSKALRIGIMEGKFPMLDVRLEKIYKRADWPPPPPEQTIRISLLTSGK